MMTTAISTRGIICWPLLLVIAGTALTGGCSQLRQASGTDTAPPLTSASQQHANFDFVPGSHVLWHETFSSAAIGDLPKGWDTNASAEVTKGEGTEQRSLLLTKNGVYLPPAAGLPSSFTLQFTLSCSAHYSYYSSPLQVMFAALGAKKEFTVLKQYNPHNKDLVKLMIHPNNAASNAGTGTVAIIEKGRKQSENEISTDEFFAQGGPATVTVSVWRQKGRLRVYLNKEKVWDLPQAFAEGVVYNSLVFGIHHLADPTGKYYLSNITLATDESISPQALKAKRR